MAAADEDWPALGKSRTPQPRTTAPTRQQESAGAGAWQKSLATDNLASGASPLLDDEALAAALQAQFDAELASAPVVQLKYDSVGAVYDSMPVLSASDAPASDGPASGSRLVFNKQLVGLANALFADVLELFVGQKDEFEEGDILEIIALDAQGFTLRIAELARDYAFFEPIASETDLHEQMALLVEEQRKEREYDKLDAAERRYMNGTLRERNPILQGQRSAAATVAALYDDDQDGYSESADDMLEQHQSAGEEEGDGSACGGDADESAKYYLGGKPAVVRPKTDELMRVRKAQQHSVHYTIRDYVRVKEESLVRFDRPPEDMAELLHRINMRCNRKGRAKYTRAFDAVSGAEILDVAALQPRMVILCK